MVARIPVGIFDQSEPATKVDGLLWLTPMGELAIWFNGQWRARGGSVASLQAYGATTLTPNPADAAIAIVGAPVAGPGNAWPNPGPFTNGQLWYNTTTSRLTVWSNIGFIPIP